MKELESYLPADCDEEDAFRFDRLRLCLESGSLEDMQPVGEDGGGDVVIANQEDLTQENCLQAQAALLINPNLIGDASTTAENLAAIVNILRDHPAGSNT